MPIHNRIHADEGYFVSVWEGRIEPDELMPSYQSLLQEDGWFPGMPELVDLSLADLSALTSRDLTSLAHWAAQLHRRTGADEVKVAVYAPGDLPFGLARVYEQVGENEAKETTRVFRDPDQARAWLTGGSVA